MFLQFDITFNNSQIINDHDATNDENDLENDSDVIDIDKLSPIHSPTTGINCDRGDGDGAIWQKVHAEDSML